MDQKKLKLTHTSMLAVPVPAADALLSAGSPEAAMLYLYMLRRDGVLDMEAALRDLPMTQAALRAAADVLFRQGLLSGKTGEGGLPMPGQELPEYQAKDVVLRTAEDPAFKALVEESQRALGRVLSSADLKKLFGIYDDLALPPEVIMLLINHCREDSEYRYGPGKHLGFSAIEKEAYAWVNREIVTHELAEEWLAKKAARRTQVGALRARLGIQNRALLPTEAKYMEEWLELGFGPEEILLAADRTVANTGELRLRYTNSILQSWHKKDLHTVAEIEKGDRKPARRSGKGGGTEPAPVRDDSEAMAQLARLREQMKNG